MYRWERACAKAAKGSYFVAVSCASSRACTAVGARLTGRRCSKRDGSNCVQSPLVENWDGARWSIERVRAPRGAKRTTLTAVSCASSGACVVVGSSTDASGRFVALIERRDGSSWVMDRDVPDVDLTAVSCSSARACTAVGGFGKSPAVLRWNGAEWAVQHASHGDLPVARERLRSAGLVGPPATRLSSVSCPAIDACVAVGTVSYGCTGCGPDSIDFGLTERWDGATWRVENNPMWQTKSDLSVQGELDTVSCSSASVCTAIGNGPTLRSTGAGWTSQRTQDPPADFNTGFTGVACPSTSTCVLVGFYGLSEDGPSVAWAQLWNGSRWSSQNLAVTPSAPTPAELSGVSCVSSRACVAVGEYRNATGVKATLAVSWDGSRWTVQPTPNAATGFEGSNELASVSCLSRRFCMAVGWSEAGAGRVDPLAEEWTGAGWRIIPTPRHPGPTVKTYDQRLNAVSCAAPDACAAVGTTDSTTLAERWNGQKWTVERTANRRGGFNELDGVSCPSPTMCIAVGTKPQRWDGSNWTAIPDQPTSASMGAYWSAVSCRSPTACTAVGTGPVAAFWNGTQWTASSSPDATGFTPELTGVSCSSVASCLAVGSRDRLSGPTVTYAYRWDGLRWAPLHPGPAGRLAAVSCTSRDRCTAVGDIDGAALAERYS